jgi:hypothetical protein
MCLLHLHVSTSAATAALGSSSNSSEAMKASAATGGYTGSWTCTCKLLCTEEISDAAEMLLQVAGTMLVLICLTQ